MAKKRAGLHYRPRTAATVAREGARARKRAPAKPRPKRIGMLPLRAPFFTSEELQQYEYMNAIGSTVAGTMTPEYQEERRAWIATQKRAAKRYGARRAKSRPKLVKHRKPTGRVRVRAYTRRRPGKAS